MKKLKPSLRRGIEAEARFIVLARSLKSPGFIRSVRKASPTLDQHGIDVIIFVHSTRGNKDIKVPVQVKSSVTGIQAFQRKHQRCIEAGVVSVVVNGTASDERIRNELCGKLEYIQWVEKDFSEFFLELRNARKGRHLKQLRFSKRFKDYLEEKGGL